MKKFLTLFTLFVVAVNAFATAYTEKSYATGLIKGWYMGVRDYERMVENNAELTRNADGSYSFTIYNLTAVDSTRTHNLGNITVDNITATTGSDGLTTLAYSGDVTVGAGSDTSVDEWLFEGQELKATLYAEVYSDHDIYVDIYLVNSVSPSSASSSDQDLSYKCELEITFGQKILPFVDELTIEVEGKDYVQEDTVLLMREPDNSYTVLIEDIIVPEVGGIGTLCVEGIESTAGTEHSSLEYIGKGFITEGSTEGVTWKYAGQSIMGRFSGKLYNSDDKLSFNILPFASMGGQMIGVEFGNGYPNTEYYTSELMAQLSTGEEVRTTSHQTCTIELTENSSGVYTMVLDNLVINAEDGPLPVGNLTIEGITSTKSAKDALVDTLRFSGTVTVTAGSDESKEWPYVGTELQLSLYAVANSDTYLFALFQFEDNVPGIVTWVFGELVTEYDGPLGITVDGIKQPDNENNIVRVIERVGDKYTVILPNVVLNDDLAIGTIVINDVEEVSTSDTLSVYQFIGEAEVNEGYEGAADWSMAGETIDVLFYAEQDNRLHKLYASMAFTAGNHSVNLKFGESKYNKELTDTLVDELKVFYNGNSMGAKEGTAIISLPDDLSPLMGLTLKNIVVDGVGGIGTVDIDGIEMDIYPMTDAISLAFSGNAQVLAGDDPNVTSWLYAGQTVPVTLEGEYFISDRKIHVTITIGEQVKIEYGTIHAATITYNDELVVFHDGVKSSLQQDVQLTLYPVFDEQGVLVDTLAKITIPDLWIKGTGGIGTLVVDSVSVAYSDAGNSKIILMLDGKTDVTYGSDKNIWWGYQGMSIKGRLYGETYSDTRSLYLVLAADNSLYGETLYLQFGTLNEAFTDNLIVTLDGAATSQTKEVSLVIKPDDTATLEIPSLVIEGVGGIGSVTIGGIDLDRTVSDEYAVLRSESGAVVTEGDDPDVDNWYYTNNTSIAGSFYGEFYYSQQRLYFTFTPDTQIGVKEMSLVFGDNITGIKDNTISGKAANITVKDIYSVTGVRQSKMQKGLNIERMSDGTVRKIFRATE